MKHMSLLLALFLSSLLAFSNAEISSKIGINYGRLGNNLPSPYQSIELIRNTKAGRVKIYDANPEILRLLSGTKLQVTIMVTNDQIPDIASRQASADKWVRENVLQYYPSTMIRFILVGNEVLSDNNTTTTSTAQDRQLWPHLVPAMARIKNSLKAQNIKNIKVGTPLAMDILGSTFPPSSGTFRDDILEVMVPLLRFLNRTTSFFFVDVYPYFPWSENPTGMSLDFALFQGGNLTYTDPVSGLNYTNLLDQMLDAVNFAMAKLGFDNLRLAISETGWPNSGDIDQPGANLYNAATYNRNLVKKMTAKPALGTPAKPGLVIPTFIFSLYNENQKGGPGTERHWGLFNPDGRAIYELDLSGKRSSEMGYRQLPEPGNNMPYRGKIWCVVAEGVDSAELNSALLYVCGEGNGTCSALAPGSECYEPVWEVAHASYAFSSYWAKFRSSGATCYFNGLAVQTTTDPSHGSCRFPSVTL